MNERTRVVVTGIGWTLPLGNRIDSWVAGVARLQFVEETTELWRFLLPLATPSFKVDKALVSTLDLKIALGFGLACEYEAISAIFVGQRMSTVHRNAPFEQLCDTAAAITRATVIENLDAAAICSIEYRGISVNRRRLLGL